MILWGILVWKVNVQIFPYDYSEPYTSISNKDLEKEYNEDLDWVQLIEEQSQLSSSHIEVPHDLEQLETYTENYHSISLVEQCDGVVDVCHQTNVYNSPIQS